MATRYGWAFAVVIASVLVPACGPSAESGSGEPSLVFSKETSELLRDLIGAPEGQVYEFSGCFLECWLEVNTDGVVTRSMPAAVRADSFAGAGEVGEPSVTPAGVQGTVAVWGDLETTVNLHLTAASGKRQVGSGGPIAIPPLGREAPFSSLSGGDRIQPVVDLPAEPGEEFDVFRWKLEQKKSLDGSVVRSVIVTLRAKLLPEA